MHIGLHGRTRGSVYLCACSQRVHRYVRACIIALRCVWEQTGKDGHVLARALAGAHMHVQALALARVRVQPGARRRARACVCMHVRA